MTREERLAILGPDVVAAIRKRVAQAPDPSPELVEELRRIWTNPGGAVPNARPAASPLPPSSADSAAAA